VSLPLWIGYEAMGLPQARAAVLYCDKPIDLCQLAQALFG
jgi:hypothetical protein